MVSQGEMGMWRDMSRAARSLERIADAMEKLLAMAEAAEAERKDLGL